MTAALAIFEDGLTEDMGAIALTRPVFELRCGLTSLRERITRHYPDAKLHVLCREALAAVLREELAREGVEGIRRVSRDQSEYEVLDGLMVVLTSLPVRQPFSQEPAGEIFDMELPAESLAAGVHRCIQKPVDG